MALVKCKECGNEVAQSAQACPKCGAKMKKRTGCLTWIVGGFFALVVIGIVIGNLESQKRAEEQQSESARKDAARQAEEQRVVAMTPDQRAEYEKQEAATHAAAERYKRLQLGTTWRYGEEADEMTKKNMKWAIVSSVNQIEFEFPYQGPQRATLQLRIHPRHGKDAMLSVERGQFNCGVDECYVSIRFDDGAPQKFSVGEPADHSNTLLFIQNYARFLTGLRKADTVYIEAPFFQQGNRVFQFDVDGLEWP